MLRGGYDNEVVLFTAEEPITSEEVVYLIHETSYGSASGIRDHLS